MNEYKKSFEDENLKVLIKIYFFRGLAYKGYNYLTRIQKSLFLCGF